MPDPSFYAKVGRLSGIVTILPATMAAGWVFGYYVIDRFLHTFPWGSVVAAFLGACVGMYEIFRLLTSARDEGS
jgi:F0F1-type ATP synthase assembly protein I